MILAIFSMNTPSNGLNHVKLEEAPAIIFYNGNIITMEDAYPNVDTIAIQGDVIHSVGNESDILSLGDSNTHYIDLQGKTIVPGFIDSHSHWIGDRGLTNQSELEEVMDILVSNGWTSISELFVNQDRLNELQATDLADLLKVRVNAYLPLSWQFERFGDWYQQYEPGHEYSPNLRIAGVKFFMDRWYTVQELYFNQSELEGLFQEAHDLGFQISIHSVITNATDVVLNAFETVLGGEWNHQRHRMEHLVLLRDDQITRMANLGIYGCIQFPWFTSNWIEFIETGIGLESTHLVGRWRDLQDAGVHLLGSTDYPYNLYENTSPIQSMSMAVTRVGLEGPTPTDYMLNQTLTPEEALRHLTINGAYGSFQEDVKGSLKPGKLADIVVLSHNPLTVPESELVNIKVLMTMIGGNEEFIDESFTTSLSTSTTKSTTTTKINASTLVPTSLGLILIYIRRRKRKFREEN
ncbi:MAG: amidohydrolase [Candidatus Hodarchaeales archaeon]|jgi:predicted amidohydrolase YtcJ